MKAAQLTEILNRENIDENTWNQIFPIVYQQMKVLAKNVKFGHKKNTVLNTTSLVHEAYIKLQNNKSLNVEGSKHFYKLAALAMRQIMLDTARAGQTAKRTKPEHDNEEEQFVIEINNQVTSPSELIEIDMSLTNLEEFNPRLAEIVIHHFYGGYTFEKIAEMLDISKRTAIRDWKKAKAFIFTQLNH